MSSPINIITILDKIEGIASAKNMNSLIGLLWSLDININLSEEKVQLLRELVDKLNTKIISNDEFEQETMTILQEYRSPDPSHRRGSDILRKQWEKKKFDFKGRTNINFKTSPEIEKAMKEHRSGRKPSGISILFTPSPHSESTPSPPIITDRISTGEPTKFGDMISSQLLRPNPRRDITGTRDLNPMDGSINVGQPKHISTPLLADEDDYDPDNCSDCEGGCCGGRKRKTKKRKKRKTKKRKTKKRKNRKNRTKRRKKRTRKQKGGGLLEILGLGNSTSDTLREIAQNQRREQKTLTVTPEEAKHATNDDFQLLDSNEIQKEQDAEKEQKRREENRKFYIKSAQQDWDDINTSIKRIYPSGGEGNPFQPNIGPIPKNFETAKYFKEK